jgi:hypothetical protein
MIYLALEVIRKGNKLLRCWALSRPILDKIGQTKNQPQIFQGAQIFYPAPFKLCGRTICQLGTQVIANETIHIKGARFVW